MKVVQVAFTVSVFEYINNFFLHDHGVMDSPVIAFDTRLPEYCQSASDERIPPSSGSRG
jgi:hypothetical protein